MGVNKASEPVPQEAEVIAPTVAPTPTSAAAGQDPTPSAQGEQT